MKNNFSGRVPLTFWFLFFLLADNWTIAAAQPCDTIFLKTGESILAKIKNRNARSVVYRRCDESRDWLYKVDLKNVRKITSAPSASPEPDDSKEINLAGPRIGFVVFTGHIAKRIQDSSNKGGLSAKPVMSQFGYQFEKSYISNDKVQALFEFLPNVTGLDQGKFLPSFSILHGLRFNQTGWEFIVGPIIYASKRAEGFFDENDNWMRLSDWKIANPSSPEPDDVKLGLDTRGDYGLTTSFLLSIGKTFHSGDLNFPVNVFTIPHAEGMRYGVSVGFNRRK